MRVSSNSYFNERCSTRHWSTGTFSGDFSILMAFLGHIYQAWGTFFMFSRRFNVKHPGLKTSMLPFVSDVSLLLLVIFSELLVLSVGFKMLCTFQFSSPDTSSWGKTQYNPESFFSTLFVPAFNIAQLAGLVIDAFHGKSEQFLWGFTLQMSKTLSYFEKSSNIPDKDDLLRILAMDIYDGVSEAAK